MPKTAIWGSKCGQICTGRSRKQKDSGFFGNSNVKKISNAIPLRLSEDSIVNYKNRSHAVTAEVVVPQSGAEGVIVAIGGTIGGWSLYAKNGKPIYYCNFYGVDYYSVEG